MQKNLIPQIKTAHMQQSRRRNHILARAFMAAGIILALAAVSPKEWVKKLGDWGQFIIQWQVPILATLIVILMIQLALAKQPFLARLEYILPSEYHGIPDMAPRGIQSKITGIIELLNQSPRETEHVVRILVLTGQSTLHYLNQIIDKYHARASWEIRILLVDPTSPEIESLEEGATEQVSASCALLDRLRRRIESKERPVKIYWRGYTHLPTIRAFLIDDQHMFFGYFAWQKESGIWKLHEQNKKFIYAKQGDELSRDSIDFFKNWFDHEWEHGRIL